MTNIKNEDYIFLTALKEQHKHKEDKSFLSILYCVNMEQQDDLYWQQQAEDFDNFICSLE